MTLKELYEGIGGDYEQAMRVLRMEKLLDKHIRKLPGSGVVARLINAGAKMDPTEMFETSHAVKGSCANLGLTRLSALASEISEEYRPGNPRKMSDAEVKALIDKIGELYNITIEGIRKYAEG